MLPSPRPRSMQTPRLALLFAWLVLASTGAQAEVDLLPSIAVSPTNIEVKLETVASGGGLTIPSDLVPVPDGSGRLFVTMIGGDVRVIDGGVLLPTVYMSTFSGDSFYSGDTQFTTMAFHPDFANSGQPGYRKFYTIEPEKSSAGVPDFLADFGGDNHHDVVYEYTVDDETANVFSGTRRELMRARNPGTSHNFYDLAFDTAGLLYMSVGDGQNDTTVSQNANVLTNPYGKILRIDPLGLVGATSANGEYSIPTTNPFYGMGGGTVEEIYATGLRSPFRMTFDSATGDIWLGDVGQDNVEEINRIPAGSGGGQEFAWTRREGSFQNTTAVGGPALPGDTLPVFEYDHQDGGNVAGGYIYNGSDVPALAGLYVFGDYQGNRDNDPQVPPVPNEGRIFYGDPGSGDLFEFNTDPTGADVPYRVVSIGEDADGELYVLGNDQSFQGTILRIAQADSSSGDPDFVLHAPLDTSALIGATASDLAGTPEDGTINGAGVTNPAGQIAEALDFPGADSDFLDFGDVYDPGTGSYTVSFWFNAADVSATSYLASKGNVGSSDPGWSLFIQSGTLIARGQRVGGASGERFSQSIGGAIADATWHHVALVIDTDTNTVRGYLDGSNTGWVAGGGGGVVDTLVPGGDVSSADDLLVARRSSAGAPFDGAVDDLAIWTRALSASEVATLFSNGGSGLDASSLPPPAPPPDLNLHATFDTADLGGGGTVANDTAGTAQNGAINGAGVTNPAGQIAEALDFPGADTDHVDFGDVFDPGSGSMTISLWFNADDVATTQFVAGKGNTGSSSVGWSIFIESGTLIVRGQRVGGASGERFSQSIAGTIASSTWHHVAMVIDTENDVVRGYLDGSNAGWVAGGGGGQVDTLVDGHSIENGDALLVARRGTAGAPFAGLIDDFAIWTRALAPSEVAAVHTHGQSGMDASTLPPGSETLELLVSGNGSVVASPDQAEYSLGQSVQLTATADPGWVFTGFSGSLVSLDNPASIVISGGDSVTANFAQAEVAILQPFDTLAVGADPPGWMDTGADRSLIEDDSLFEIMDVEGEKVFGTDSSLINIHSHYVAAEGGNLASYDYTGRMRMSSDTGIGVTFNSQFPDDASYHRLRRLPGESFRLFPTGPTIDGGVTDTGVIPVVDTWYRFHVQVEDTGAQTNIRAKVWEEGNPEPVAWQADAFDQGSDRLRAGTIGVWPSFSGSKYWDDLSVVGSYSQTAEDMVLHATLDDVDTTGSVIRDRAGVPEDGTLQGAGSASVAGQLAEARDLPGADTDHIDFGDVHDPGTDSYSVSLWFNADSVSGVSFLAGKGNTGSSVPGWSLFLENGTLIARGHHVGGGSGDRFSQSIAGTVAADTWHHVVMVIDTANDVVRGYLDGTNTGWVTGGGGGQVDTLLDGVPISSGDPLLVGRRTTGGVPFDGTIDDVAIFTRALTANDVTQLYENATLNGLDASYLVPDPPVPPVQEIKLHTTLDTADISGSTVLDLAGTSEDGTLVGAGVTNPAGQMGEALGFPGADTDHVDYGDVLDPGDGSYTVSLWFNASDVTTTQFLAGKGNAASGDVGWSLFVEDGELIVRGQQTNALASQRFGQHIPGTIATSTWHHAALVIDRNAQTVRGYLDGSNAGWLTGGGGALVDTLVPGLSIANGESILLARRATTGAPFTGLIDDFAIFNRALTSGQVATLHANGLLGDDASTLGPLSGCGDGVIEGAETCDDGNAVGGDCCSATCQFELDGSACEDGNACTIGDSCNSVGVCISGGPLACDDSEICTDDACDVSLGCVFTPNADPCDDLDACTTADMCVAGSCVGGAPPVCDDGVTCNGAESCDPGSGCIAGSPPDPDDGIACTIDSCVEPGGVQHVPDDGLCDDSDPCTADSCDEVLGCLNDPIPACTPQVSSGSPWGQLVLAVLLLIAGTGLGMRGMRRLE